MSHWAAAELSHIDLGDIRRNRRLVQIVEDLASQPSVSVPQASRDAAALQGMYDFWKSRRVDANQIIKAHAQSTVSRMNEVQVVLAIQDTTEFNFTSHKKMAGLGHLDHGKCRGLKCHSVLAVTDTGTPLGLLHQKIWARDIDKIGQKHQRHLRSTSEKESQRWLDHLKATQATIPEGIRWVMVADREADIYDLFAEAEQLNSHFLVRATQDRQVKSTDPDVEDTAKLVATMQRLPPAGTSELFLCRHPKREARQAKLSIRFQTLDIQPPMTRAKKEDLKPIRLQVILAQEENPPEGEKAICWLLLTTLEVGNLEAALRTLRWYSYRWLIERYHFTLKSGCLIEELQLSTADRLERALATYAIVAWRLLWITYEARENPEQSCDTFLEAHEWQSLYCTIHKTSNPPLEPPTIRDAVRWIAQLGGFIGRKADGEPGVKTIWRGLRRLNDIAITWKVLRT